MRMWVPSLGTAGWGSPHCSHSLPLTSEENTKDHHTLETRGLQETQADWPEPPHPESSAGSLTRLPGRGYASQASIRDHCKARNGSKDPHLGRRRGSWSSTAKSRKMRERFLLVWGPSGEQGKAMDVSSTPVTVNVEPLQRMSNGGAVLTPRAHSSAGHSRGDHLVPPT